MTFRAAVCCGSLISNETGIFLPLRHIQIIPRKDTGSGPHLKPVGLQSTNWIVRFVLIVATYMGTIYTEIKIEIT